MFNFFFLIMNMQLEESNSLFSLLYGAKAFDITNFPIYLLTINIFYLLRAVIKYITAYTIFVMFLI